jgi:hypothetical protein
VASAETNSQQPGPDVPIVEMKAEVQTEDTEPEPGETKGEPRSEVGKVVNIWLCVETLSMCPWNCPWMSLDFVLILCLNVDSESELAIHFYCLNYPLTSSFI